MFTYLSDFQGGMIERFVGSREFGMEIIVEDRCWGGVKAVVNE